MSITSRCCSKGAPDEINEARLREHEFGFGPAGLISPDDIEIMERNQLRRAAPRAMTGSSSAAACIATRWLPDGGASGYTMDECHLRGMWQHYGRLMNARMRR